MGRQEEEEEEDEEEEVPEDEDYNMGDEMQNHWGTGYMLAGTGTSRGCGTQSSFSAMITKEVPGFQLNSLAVSGTGANTIALNLATGTDYTRALFAVGSYVGGDATLQKYSTSGYDVGGRFAMPTPFCDTSQVARSQNVPLPYLIDCKAYDQEKRNSLEEKCLRHLHKVLLSAMFNGKPYKTLLLEYVLGGCGGELSHSFLAKLGLLLMQFDCTVIADEILTGARIGPMMCMTSSMPSTFKAVVSHITLGKWMKCGMVLEPIPEKPVILEEGIRGLSTEWNYGPPSAIFKVVAQKIDEGVLVKRRKKVLKAMGLLTKKEAVWPSRGLIMFTEKTRYPIMYGLKNRILPRMDDIKVVTLSLKPCAWNASKVCTYLVTSTENWISMQEREFENGKTVFVDALIRYLFSTRIHEFRAEDVVAHIGSQKAEEMALIARQRILEEEGTRCKKKPEAFVKAVINNSIRNTRCGSDAVVHKKRRGYDRTEFTVVREDFLFHRKTNKQLLS